MQYLSVVESSWLTLKKAKSSDVKLSHLPSLVLIRQKALLSVEDWASNSFLPFRRRESKTSFSVLDWIAGILNGAEGKDEDKDDEEEDDEGEDFSKLKSMKKLKKEGIFCFWNHSGIKIGAPSSSKISSCINLFLFLEAANSGIVAMSLGFLLGIKSIEEGENEFEKEDDDGDEEEDEEEDEEDDKPFKIIEEEGDAGNWRWEEDTAEEDRVAVIFTTPSNRSPFHFTNSNGGEVCLQPLIAETFLTCLFLPLPAERQEEQR